MTIPSNYYADVAKDGRWFCTVELGEGLPGAVAVKFGEIKKRFPEADGFQTKLFEFRGGSKEVTV